MEQYDFYMEDSSLLISYSYDPDAVTAEKTGNVGLVRNDCRITALDSKRGRFGKLPSIELLGLAGGTIKFHYVVNGGNYGR